MMTDTAGTRTRDRSRRRAGGRRGGRHPQGHPPRRGRQRGDRRGAGRHAGPGDPGGLRPAPRLRPLPRAHSDDRHRGHRLLGGGPGPPPRGAAGAPTPGVIRPRAPPGAAAGEPRIRSEPEPPPAEHRPGADALPVAKTGTGPCEQIRVLLAWRRSAMKARARRPPADHRPAGHRPRRRAHPPRTVSAARGLIDALARTRPAPATHRPRPGRPRERCAARVRRHRIPGRRDRRHRHRAARTDRPRRPDDARHQGAAPSTTATPLAGADRQPRPNPHRGILRRPVRRRPDPRRPPGRPTATDSTAAATDRPTGSRTPTPRPPGDPRTKARAARLTATGKNCKEILRRPRTRHRPPSTAPAGPPPTRTPHRRPAPTAPRTRTHPPPKPPTT